MTAEILNILLIEDEVGDAFMLRRMLGAAKNLTFQITHVTQLDQALDHLSRHPYDVILLDLSLPDSRGIETFTAVHRQSPATAVVVVTGLDDEAVAMAAVRQGAQDYLIKGNVPDSLLIQALRYAIERKWIEKKLLNYQRQLRSLSLQLALTGEKERRRIATDLHDDLGQNLAFAKLKLSMLSESAGEEDTRNALIEIRDFISQAIQYTRSLTFELCSPILYELGFAPAVESLLELFRDRHRLQTTFTCNGDDPNVDPKLDPDLRIVLYQSVRELLVNVAKHAQAKSLDVSIRHGPNEIQITVEDDGIGFDISTLPTPSAESGGFGLFNIRERLDCFGGDCRIETQPGQGTRIVLCAPLNDQVQNIKERIAP